MIRHPLLPLLLSSSLCLAASFSSFKNFPVVGLRSSPASPLPLLALEGEQEVQEVQEPAARRLEELVEEVPRQARQADVNSYSDSNLDDTFIEEALFLTPEDREEREYSPRFEDWQEEEEGVEEEVRIERDGLGGHHGAHHGAHEEDHAAPMPVRRRSRKGGRRQQQQQAPARRQEARPEESFRGQEQDEREGRQTGAVGFAAGGGGDGGVGVLSSPPNAAGDYNFNFSNDDGSSRQETAGPQGVSGSYSFFTPEGEEVSIQYIADETGFHATGSHVPKAPPMPPAIRRMLDHLAKVNGHAKLY